jgi:hypothetical protein
MPRDSTCARVGANELEVDAAIGAHLHCSLPLLENVEYDVLIEQFRAS